MADRRKSTSTTQAEELAPEQALARYRKMLAIDRDDLDSCVTEQPELYWHVAQACALAIADRDATKLDLEKLEAEEDLKLRNRAAQMEEKITDKAIRAQALLNPKIMGVYKMQLEQQALIGELQALKESFQQRSFMLRELVPLQLSKLSGGSVHARLRDTISETNKARADELRERKGYRSDR